MNKQKEKQAKKERRQKSIRARISGTSTKPRLNVYKSNTGMYVQLIDDTKGATLVSVHSREIKKTAKRKSDSEALAQTKINVSYELGRLIASRAKIKKLKKVVFDRGGNKYHGRIKAIADGAREGGLEF